ncbi:MAG TPA: CopD family protein [Propionibacteriaceae bacterium]|jgi:copper transport protein|nr:CopD family protein [Propionibacteriaceae bacterium]
MTLNQDLMDLALGANRVLTYGGYVLLAGTLTFWSVVWPDGRRNRRLVVLAVAGTAAMIIGTLAGPAIQLILGGRLLGDVVTPLGGAAQFARLAALIAAVFFLPDIVKASVVGWRRAVALTLVVFLAGTMVAQSNAIGGHWEVAKIAATGLHVLATCAWLGGLVALAAVLIPGENLMELDQLIPRFSKVAQLSVVTLVITGIVHALAVAGGISKLATSRYGLVLLIKVMIFGLMLLMGNHGRKYAIRAAFRQLHQQPDAPARSGGVSALAVTMGAELCIAFVILSTTALLVMVAPHP